MTSSADSVLPAQNHLQPIPPSPSRSFASTAVPAASLNTPAPPPPPLPGYFLSSCDVKVSIAAYETLSEAAKAYRKSLTQVASAASSFGAALETCARCKGAGDTADGLMGGSGLQYLVASNMHLLSDAIYRGFEIPLLHEVDNYKEKNTENEERYKRQASEKTRELHKRETQHLKLARQKNRNLSSFRGALLDLTAKVDELENLKYTHYRTSLDLSQETSARILDSTALVVRAEVEVFEKIASKGWDASGGLDDLISRAGDPFAANPNYGNSGEGEIFSILPTESILPSPHGALSRAGSISGVGGSIATKGKYQSLTGALSQNGDYDECDDVEDTPSIFSGGFSSAGASKSKLGLPGFSPSVSSAGWGNIDQRTYSLESQLHELSSHIGEGTESSDNSRTSLIRHGGGELPDPNDGDTSTSREHSIN